jgi:hydrogenase assembly chaperone HypC/HupF
MCLSAPVLVVSVDGHRATVDAGGRHLQAGTLLVPEVRPGDWALMTAGALVRVLDPDAASELAAAFRNATGASP